MKKGWTELAFILDRSGSMHGLEGDTIGGFNSMLEKQRRTEGEALVSTVLFDDSSEVIHDRVSLRNIADLTQAQYTVRGCTALYDAVGGAIRHIGSVHKSARSEDVPEHTLFIITTDGMENASRRFTADEVRAMITRQKKKYGWEFLFLGANMDAAASARSIGIDGERAVSYHSDPTGTRLNYDVLGETVVCMRASAAIPGDWKRRIEEDFSRRKSFFPLVRYQNAADPPLRFMQRRVRFHKKVSLPARVSLGLRGNTGISAAPVRPEESTSGQLPHPFPHQTASRADCPRPVSPSLAQILDLQPSRLRGTPRGL